MLYLFMMLSTCFALPHHGRSDHQTRVHSVAYTMSTPACSVSHLFSNGQTQSNGCHIDTNSTNIADLSLCPWVQEIDVDPERVPREIPFAKCRCSKCSGGLVSFLTVCQPVYTTMTVWKKSSQSDQYHQMWLRVPIACTCSIPLYLGSAKK